MAGGFLTSGVDGEAKSAMGDVSDDLDDSFGIMTVDDNVGSTCIIERRAWGDSVTMLGLIDDADDFETRHLR